MIAKQLLCQDERNGRCRLQNSIRRTNSHYLKDPADKKGPGLLGRFYIAIRNCRRPEQILNRAALARRFIQENRACGSNVQRVDFVLHRDRDNIVTDSENLGGKAAPFAAQNYHRILREVRLRELAFICVRMRGDYAEVVRLECRECPHQPFAFERG